MQKFEHHGKSYVVLNGGLFEDGKELTPCTHVSPRLANKAGKVGYTGGIKYDRMHSAPVPSNQPIAGIIKRMIWNHTLYSLHITRERYDDRKTTVVLYNGDGEQMASKVFPCNRGIKTWTRWARNTCQKAYLSKV